MIFGGCRAGRALLGAAAATERLQSCQAAFAEAASEEEQGSHFPDRNTPLPVFSATLRRVCAGLARGKNREPSAGRLGFSSREDLSLLQYRCVCMSNPLHFRDKVEVKPNAQSLQLGEDCLRQAWLRDQDYKVSSGSLSSDEYRWAQAQFGGSGAARFLPPPTSVRSSIHEASVSCFYPPLWTLDQFFFPPPPRLLLAHIDEEAGLGFLQCCL